MLFDIGQAPRATSHRKTEKSTSLYDYVPRVGAGTVLWTSRDQRIVGALVDARQRIQVGQMSPDEARELLETSSNEKISGEEVDNAKNLLEGLQFRMGCRDGDLLTGSSLN